jgi:CRISPR-associated Cas5-like protein
LLIFKRQSYSRVETLQAVRIQVSGSFNSLRIGSGIKYHRTYYVPTKTTLVGLLGSAMGMDENELQGLFSSIRTNAILKNFAGIATDLWLVTKLKTQGKTESSPIMREILFEPQYSIYYSIDGSKNNNMNLDDIVYAFYDPSYALSLGRSDEMILVKEVAKVNLQQSTNEYYFKNTILPFNYKDYFDKYDSAPLHKGQTFSLPQVVSIPISFKIEDGLIRRPLEYLQITMVYDRGVKIRNREDILSDGERKFFFY